MLLVSIGIAAISALALLAFSGVQVRAEQPAFQPIFKQDETIRRTKGKDVLKYMNFTVDPCHDFFEFACGNWGKYHTAAKDHEAITLSSLLETKINNDMQNILDEQVTLEDGTAGRKIKDFYRSCLTIERNGQLQQTFFSEFIKTNGGFPAVPGSNWLVHHHNYDWQEVVAQLRNHYGMDILIGLEVDISYLSTTENSIYLSEPSTLIPAELCNAEGTKRVDIREREYERIENEIVENLKMWLTLKTTEEAKILAADIVSFEFELCAAMKLNRSTEENSTVNPNYARKTLAEFSRQFNDRINFNQFVSASFGAPINTPVFMKAESYFRQLIKTVSEANKTTIANYIMYRALSLLSIPPEDHMNKRTHYCLSMLKRYYPKVIGEMYYRKYAGTSASEIEILFDKLKDSFRGSLQSAWIEDSTSRVGRDKLNGIVLGFPIYDEKAHWKNLPQPLNGLQVEKNHLNDLKIDSRNYWNILPQVMAQVRPHQLSRVFETGLMNKLLPLPHDEVEAYETRMKYRMSHNRIDLGWGLFQPPYYQQLYPNGMRYAMIGQKMAHQLATAIYGLSLISDPSNWDYRTKEEYKVRTECFRRQISNYLYNSPETFHNSTQVRQMIATSGGLNVAFNAYLIWLSYLDPNNDYDLLMKETLPGVNYTNTQLFFITYAQMFCRAEKKGTRPPPMFSPLMKHTVERYEVNGPLKNSAEFAREFGCAAGAEMNPADKCVIY